MANLTGRTVLVTGATSGIGLEAAVVFARMGARVAMVGRDPKKTALRREEVRQRSGSDTVDSLLCDFSSQAQIRHLAGEVLAKYDRLHVLVNNAGTVFAKRTLTEDGIEATFAINHLGYFLFTQLLVDLLIKSAPARVVNVASVGHRRATLDFGDLGFERGYGVMRAYARSKLGNVLYTRELARRLEDKGVTVNCLHPGTVATSIWDGAPRWAKPILALVRPLFMISSEEGAETIVYLATSPEVEGKAGLYFEKNLPIAPSKLAQDETLGRRLWDESAKLVKLPP